MQTQMILTKTLPTLSLPLMMFGKNGNQWHEKGEPVKVRRVIDHTIYKTGQKKGQKRAVYSDWEVKLKKQKTLVGYDGIYKSGKNKGQPKPLFETRELPVLSTGFFPTVNHIYMNGNFRGGGGRKLKPIAENHLQHWNDLVRVWIKEHHWVTQKAPVKVVCEMFFYLPNGRCDTHNAKKLLLDALQPTIHEDDYYLLDRTIDFAIDNDNPRVEISFSLPNNLMPLS